MKKILFLVSILFLLSGCSNEVYTKSFFSMDTMITVKVYEQKDEQYLEDVKDIFDEYHKASSMFEEGGNNIYRFNEMLEVGEDMEISSNLHGLLEYSLDWYESTNHVFNPCMGNVTLIWKDYRDGIKEGIPSPEELEDAGSISCSDVLLEDNKITKLDDVKIDLGAVAKGYTTEQARKYLEANGVEKYLISAGGNVVVGDPYKNNEGYAVGIQSPISDNEVFKTLNVTDMAIVTSGSYERFYEYDGVKYSHIISSETLYPTRDKLSVTVITPSSSEADILSTYLFLLPYEKGLEYVQGRGDLEVIWYFEDNTIKTTEGLKNYES